MNNPRSPMNSPRRNNPPPRSPLGSPRNLLSPTSISFKSTSLCICLVVLVRSFTQFRDDYAGYYVDDSPRQQKQQQQEQQRSPPTSYNNKELLFNAQQLPTTVYG